ncbi:hypothetical protein [Microseira sp. BLCC-F43]|uniref:hypothetical protein n=1 Tax=Microseira sp. BLCC-F43 TaxID=3153602 RepID=UPI0035B903F6
MTVETGFLVSSCVSPELYDRIRQTSREEVILEEMIRLGFWPAQGTVPQDPADEIRRQGEIYRELGELYRIARENPASRDRGDRVRLISSETSGAYRLASTEI